MSVKTAATSHVIDLRSDTVTRPTQAMRRAMAVAAVGDDVRQEDPTVRSLEIASAKLTGKEAGLFLPSGTMSNLVAILSHSGKDGPVLVGDQSHVFRVENGISEIAGVRLCSVPNSPDGGIRLEDVRRAAKEIRPSPRLLVLENTHSYCGGIALRPAYLQALRAEALGSDLMVHVDGARIFNAAVVTNTPVTDLARSADSISFCLSKGLAAPAGSMLCGGREFVDRCRRLRQILGGAMRQSGVLAAAGLVAIQTMIRRLEKDHDKAERLRLGLEALGLETMNSDLRTNMVFVVLDDAEAFQARLARRGILVSVFSPRLCRLVTHLDVDDRDVDEVLERLGRA